MIQELTQIFNPKSVAVVGASSNPDKMGYILLKGFVDLGFGGNLYPINPDISRSVCGLSAYASVKDVPGDIDLAVITLSPETVPVIIKECIEKRVRGIIISSAFPEGVNPQETGLSDILDLARQNGVRIIGPNALGIYCPSTGVALFSDMPKKTGTVGFISHSGAMSWSVSHYLANRGVGLSKVVSCGNEWDLTWTDFLEYLGQDPDTEIIAGYMEGVKCGTRFIQVAKEIAREKPIILIKAGTSSARSEFASSHTGSIAGNRNIWSAAFNQAGVISVDSFDDLVDHVITFNYLRDHVIGNRIGIISGTGGPIVILADLCEKLGLRIPLLSDQTREELRKFLPAYGTSDRNPVDVSVAAATNFSLFTQPIELLGRSDEVDALICVHTGDWGGEELAKAIVGISGHTHKPLMVVLLGTPEKNIGAILSLLQAGIPAFTSLGGVLRAFASLVKWKIRK